MHKIRSRYSVGESMLTKVMCSSAQTPGNVQHLGHKVGEVGVSSKA